MFNIYLTKKSTDDTDFKDSTTNSTDNDLDLSTNSTYNTDLKDSTIENHFENKNSLEQYLSKYSDEASNKEDFLDSNDDDEVSSSDKIYIISIDKVPHFYEHSLIDAKKRMWDLATNLLKTSNDSELGNANFILSRNVYQAQIVSPYKLLMLNYNHILFDLKIDYVIKFNLKK